MAKKKGPTKKYQLSLRVDQREYDLLWNLYLKAKAEAKDQGHFVTVLKELIGLSSYKMISDKDREHLKRKATMAVQDPIAHL